MEPHPGYIAGCLKHSITENPHLDAGPERDEWIEQYRLGKEYREISDILQQASDRMEASDPEWKARREQFELYFGLKDRSENIGEPGMNSRIDSNLENDRPTAILFSSEPQTGQGWDELVCHSCGGFSCDSIDGYAYLLPLSDTVEPMVVAIADEQFCAGCENTRMDYPFGLQEQQVAYQAFVGQSGLTVSHDALATLKQAAYPLDATPDNLKILVGDNPAPSMPLDGLIILILGHNCD